MIKYWVDKQPNKTAYNWIEESDGEVSKSYTYGELWKEIESIKYHLENEWKVKKGDCVFIVYPPGLEFIFAFFGCLLAGCVAVPVYPPIPGRTLKKGVDKLKLLQKSCLAKIALTSKSYNVARRTSKVLSFKAKWPKNLKWYITDNIKWKPKYAVDMNEINIDEKAVAFLQYTSGSTGDPKGVMILHKNYFYNVFSGGQMCIPLGSRTRLLCWLPQYHDLGLIACYTATICGGGTVYGMSPFIFLQQPSLWIHCLSKYKCNSTGAPNFAFALAVRKWHEPKDGHNIDLSHITYIGNGAEPIQLKVVEEFYNLFGKYGLPRGVVHPQCGLAETCVFLTVDHSIYTALDLQGTRRVCCGNVDVVKFKFGVDIRIINPETGEEVKDEEEGEIIVSSQSIAAGYMNRPQLSKEIFQFQLPNNHNSSEDKYYLKTGDLGMIVKPDREWSIAHPDRHPIYGQNDKLLEEELNQRHLVITGRIKDLIILNGRNYYPQDIELCVENALTNKQLVRSGCVVATSIEWNNEESFAVVCELRKGILDQHVKDKKKKDNKLTKELVLKQICIEMVKSIQDEFGVKPCTVALIKEKTIPKTTSGKVRRKATAAALLSTDKHTKLKLLYRYEISNPIIPEVKRDSNGNMRQILTVDSIKQTLRQILGEHLYLDQQERKKLLDDNRELSEIGISSMNLMVLTEKVEKIFNLDALDPTTLYEYSTIQQLSEYIAACKVGIKSPLNRSSDRINANTTVQSRFGSTNRVQNQVILHNQYNAASIYNIYGIWKYDGVINKDRLKSAMKTVIASHNSLLTTFYDIPYADEIIQKINRNEMFTQSSRWFYVTNNDLDRIKKLMHKPFNVRTDILFRLVLSESLLAFVVHHSIADGLSVQVIISDLSKAYNDESYCDYNLLPCSPRSLKFSLWEEQQLNSTQCQISVEFWIKHAILVLKHPFRIGKILPQSSSVLDLTMNSFDRHQSRVVQHKTMLFESLKLYNQQFTLFQLLFTAFQLYLHLLTNEDIIAVHTVYTNRPKQFWNAVGMFANTVVYSTEFSKYSSDSSTFQQLLLDVTGYLNEGKQHSWLPLSYLYDTIRHNHGYNIPIGGLSNVMFVYQSSIITNDTLNFGDDVSINLIEFSSGYSHPLAFEILAKPDNTFKSIINYDTSCFSNLEIDLLATKWNHFLNQLFVTQPNFVSNTPLLPINWLSLLSTNDHKLINAANNNYVEWNDADDTEYANGTVIDLIMKQAELYPNKVALYMNEDTLTYEELMNACFVLSNKLRDEYNIRVGDVICICMERSFEMIISIISIMICGGIYCPIHPNEAIERCNKIINRVNYKLMLCNEDTQKKCVDFKSYSYSMCDAKHESVNHCKVKVFCCH